MSTLPEGSKAAIGFLDTVIMAGLRIAATALWPPLGSPILWFFLSAFLKALIVKPAIQQGTAWALAAAFVADRKAFDREFIRLEILDKRAATPEEIEEALKRAEASMYKFIHRGPIS